MQQPDLPLNAPVEDVMKAWDFYRANIYATVCGRELYEAYQGFFYDHEATLYELAKRGFDAAA